MTGFIKELIMPSNFAIFCLFIGLILLYFQHLRKPAVILVATAGLIITIFSTGTMASLLLSPLEYEFPYVKNPAERPKIRKIVVLTHYVVNDPLIPLSSRISSSSAYRLLETKRLYNACPNCDIIISGGGEATPIMKQVLMSMGIPADKITEDDAVHTYVSAENLYKILGDEPFYLVTSAGHMPRSMRVFRKQKMHPVPAPTDFQLPNDIFSADIAPSPLHLYWSNLAVSEYIGMLWYKIRGKI